MDSPLFDARSLRRGATWLNVSNESADVVVSSRVRIARNIAGVPFIGRCDPDQREQVLSLLRDRLLRVGLGKRTVWIDLSRCEPLDRALLVERHLISKEHAVGDQPRGVAISMPDEHVSVMVNEEDHVRLQVLRGGLSLREAFSEADAIDDRLAGHESRRTNPPAAAAATVTAPFEAQAIEPAALTGGGAQRAQTSETGVRFAFSPRFGYLTACPTNVGTGVRVSAMLHLPALRLSGEIEKVQRAARDMSLAVRGSYGEGTEAVGDFYQISNQTTLGRTEQELVDELETRILPRVIEYERSARLMLIEKRRVQLEDHVMRAAAVLRSARLLAPDEAVKLLSAVRLGILSGVLSDIDLRSVNQLLLLTQPAHVQRLVGSGADQNDRRRARAELVRLHLNHQPPATPGTPEATGRQDQD